MHWIIWVRLSLRRVRHGYPCGCQSNSSPHANFRGKRVILLALEIILTLKCNQPLHTSSLYCSIYCGNCGGRILCQSDNLCWFYLSDRELHDANPGRIFRLRPFCFRITSYGNSQNKSVLATCQGSQARTTRSCMLRPLLCKLKTANLTSPETMLQLKKRKDQSKLQYKAAHLNPWDLVLLQFIPPTWLKQDVNDFCSNAQNRILCVWLWFCLCVNSSFRNRDIGKIWQMAYRSLWFREHLL